MDAKQTRSERDIFVSQFGKLLRPHVDRIIAEYIGPKLRGELSGKGNDEEIEDLIKFGIKDQQDLTAKIHEQLLDGFWTLSQSDTKIQMLLIPIMAYLRKMPE